eukprot:687335-Prymnesium_polylepis.3
MATSTATVRTHGRKAPQHLADRCSATLRPPLIRLPSRALLCFERWGRARSLWQCARPTTSCATCRRARSCSSTS